MGTESGDSASLYEIHRSTDIESALDPNYEWIEVTNFGDSEPSYIKGGCKHRQVVPIYGDGREGFLDPTPIAHLCTVCERQL